VLFAHRIFKKCIVRREGQCLVADAGELLQEVDGAIEALSSRVLKNRGSAPDSRVG